MKRADHHRLKGSPQAGMENLLKKAEWWLERNLQEMPLMGEEKRMKEGENNVLHWVLEKLRNEVGG